MRWIISRRRTYSCIFIIIIIYIILFTRASFLRYPFYFIEQPYDTNIQSPIDNDLLCITHSCANKTSTNTTIWTHDGTGIMKYIQWILTRKLSNIKITQLDNNHCIIKENFLPFNSTNQLFVQIYIVSLSVDLKNQSACAKNLIERIKTHVNHVYFKRKSVKATLLFQHLDLHKSVSVPNIEAKINKAKNVIESFSKLLNETSGMKLKIIDSEELIHSNLNNSEKSLLDFLLLFKLNKPNSLVKSIIEYDSHRFIEDAIWWDRSDVIEHVFHNSIPSPSKKLTYEDDFYHLHGSRTFVEYLIDNRQCYNHGIFAQIHSETLPHRTSTDKIDRCSNNQFDCAFSDIYSFEDREKLYEQSNYQPLKCGFTIPSIFDKVRQRYGRNHTCQTIIVTSVINCYDPLPQMIDETTSTFCFVALLDTRTYEAARKRYPRDITSQWDMVDLGKNAALFSFPAKTIEILKTAGQRMFPLAKWIIWVDGKAQLLRISEILRNTRASIFSARHSEMDRTSAKEVHFTIERIRLREGSSSRRFNRTVMDIKRQEAEYQRDGFYERSDAMGLRLFDIAMFIYRNNHPCNFRFLCGWQNEIHYFAYRGQLSVYYAAVRLNITHHFGIIPRSHYHTYAHFNVC